MYTHRLMLMMYMALLMGGLLTTQPTLAQSENFDLPPIIFITETEILQWRGGEIEFVAEMPQPNYELIPRRLGLVWHGAFVSPDLQYVAYMVITPEWQTIIGNDALRTGDHTGDNVYLVDVATGQTKSIALQETAEPHSQISRWNLRWTPDSQSLLWMEDAELGTIIRYDLSTNAFTTLVEATSPYYNHLLIASENRLIVTKSNEDNLSSNYTIYDMEGTLISRIDSLESTEAPIYQYLIPDGEHLYYGTDVERINLVDGEVSPMPVGRLLEVAATAPETSLRITPATYGDAGCTSDVLDANGQFLARIPIGNPTDISPDGSAVLYHDPDTRLYMILHVDESGNQNSIELPPLTGSSVYVVTWGEKSFIFEEGGDSFNGRFGCAAG